MEVKVKVLCLFQVSLRHNSFVSLLQSVFFALARDQIQTGYFTSVKGLVQVFEVQQKRSDGQLYTTNQLNVSQGKLLPEKWQTASDLDVTVNLQELHDCLVVVVFNVEVDNQLGLCVIRRVSVVIQASCVEASSAHQPPSSRYQKHQGV
jgi:hypothetical protein